MIRLGIVGCGNVSFYAFLPATAALDGDALPPLGATYARRFAELA